MESKDKKFDLTDAAIISSAVYTAQSADALGRLDVAEAFANEEMGKVAESYANNTEASLAGFVAEAHHAATYTINSAIAGTGEVAHRIGSTENASADIATSNGELYNPKYYSSADGSADAFSAPLNDGGEIVNKYDDQIGLMPSDQLNAVKEHINNKIASAIDSGSLAEANRLESLAISDRITDSHGISSDPLTNAQAHDLANSIKAGEIPTYGNGFNVFDTSANIATHAAEAAAITLAIDAAPIFKDIFSGKLGKDEAVNALQAYWNGQGKSLTVKSGSRAVAAGGLATTSMLDPTGAALIVSVASSLYENNKLLEKGLITKADFIKRTASSGALTAITGVAATAMGPVALLIPAATQVAVTNLENQRAVLRSFSGTLSSIQEAAFAEIGSASMKDDIYNDSIKTSDAWKSIGSLTTRIDDHISNQRLARFRLREKFLGGSSPENKSKE